MKYEQKENMHNMLFEWKNCTMQYNVENVTVCITRNIQNVQINWSRNTISVLFHTAEIKIHCKGEKTGRGKPKLGLATVTPAQILVSNTIKPLMAAFRHERHPGCPFKNRYEGVH